MPNFYEAKDIGGLKRLTDIKSRMRQEARIDKTQAIRDEMSQLQLDQTKTNIAEAKRINGVKQGFQTLMQNIPQGKNKFTAGYQYLMESGAPELANALLERKSDRIEKIWKMDKKGAIDMHNATIGSVMPEGKLEYVPDAKGKGNMVKGWDKTGNAVYFKMEGGELKRVKSPEGISFAKPEKTKNKMFADYTLEDKKNLARKYNITQKLPFAGRSNEIKAFNAEVVKLALAEDGIKGRDAVETLYASKDIEGMTKDINSQQKKLGSMRSFSLNIDKQADKINETIDKIFRMDVKILNHPINKIMTDYVGSADRATLAVFVGELTEEIGKLASGATDSVAALSEGGREKWDKIINLNLPAKALKGLISETKELGKMRVDSMVDSLKMSKNIRAGRPADYGIEEEKSPVVIDAHSEYGDITEEDIAATMEEENLTREQVLDMLEEDE